MRGVQPSSQHLSKSEQLGGGAINEKQRTFQNSNADNDATINQKTNHTWDPTNNLSHLLHSIVGLDRYPNYLSRYDESNILSIETALEQTLENVREQKRQVLQRRNGIKDLVEKYNSLTKSASIQDDNHTSSASDNVLQITSLLPPKSWSQLKSILSAEAFQVVYASIISKSKLTKQKMPSLEDVISGKVTVDLQGQLLEDLMNQECFDVYSLHLLSDDFCNRLRRVITDLSKIGESCEFSRLSLGRRPIDLDTIGLTWISDMLLHMFIRPISRHLFATTEKLSINENAPILNWRQCYVAGYSASPQEDKAVTRHRLVPHSDDSEVTLNCCLGEDNFEGGSVQFFGLRGKSGEGGEGTLLGEIERPDIGKAIIHAGRHVHAVSDVTAGNRYALIVWTRSWDVRRRTCPCCHLNRRMDSSCICDARWN